MNPPDIAISYIEFFPAEPFEDLFKEIESEKLNLFIETKPDPGPHMGLEWFLPTAAIIYIGKSYFDGFLKEAGKEHFHKLKNALSKSTNKAMSDPRIEPVIIASEGKLKPNNPYSMALSIYAEARDGTRFKLLLPKPSQGADYTNIVISFLNFLNDFHEGVSILSEIGFNEGSRPMGGLILVHMNPETQKIEWLNHRA